MVENRLKLSKYDTEIAYNRGGGFIWVLVIITIKVE